MTEAFDPYHKWLGIPKGQRPPAPFRLLGVAPDETDRDVIETAITRQSAFIRTFQTGQYASEATRLLNEIAEAGEAMLDPARRRAMATRAVPLAAPVEQPAPIRLQPIRVAPVAQPTPDPDLDDAIPLEYEPQDRPRSRSRKSRKRSSKRSGEALTYQILAGCAFLVFLAIGGHALYRKLTAEPAAAPPLLVQSSEKQQPFAEEPKRPAPPEPEKPAPVEEPKKNAPDVDPKSITVDRKEVTNSVDMKFVRILPGTFEMGSPAVEEGRRVDETPRTVKISRAFHLGVYEVTRRQYAVVMDLPDSANADPKLPMGGVSIRDAKNFCQKLSEKEGKRYRLPTEAEWEYCCRAGTTTRYAFGENLALSSARYAAIDAMPVGSFAPNAFGLYDMHGNVWEHCSDFYSPNYAELDDPQGPSSGLFTVKRGGGWASAADECRSAARGYYGMPVEQIGFRVACDDTP